MRNFSDKIYGENRDTFCVKFFFFENLAVYKIMWKNIVQSGRQQMTVRHTHIACWIPTNRLSQYVILIALSLQQWLQERPSVLYYTYIACLVFQTTVQNVLLHPKVRK
jgi:hypothetical protein